MTEMKISPQTATADHNAAPPGNSQRFLAFQTGASPGCAFLQSNLLNVTWSVSDPIAAIISNSHDQTYGTATCITGSAFPIKVIGTAPSGNGSNVSASAMLTCN